MGTLSNAILETKTMTKRNLWKSMKNPDRIMENLISPIMTLLIFVFVLGGVMSNSMDINVIDYVLPGVLILTIGQCSASTAIGISTDIQKGIIDRFRSMPISPSSILHGHVIESVIRTMLSTMIVFLVGVIFGFRVGTVSISSWLIILSVLLLFTITVTWISLAYGLASKSPEGAGSFVMFIALFTYLSSGFIPTHTLPNALRIIAENQPLTPIIESVRRLLLSMELENYLVLAIVWCLVLLIASYFISIGLFKAKANRIG